MIKTAKQDLERSKAILAARIISILDERGFSIRKAAALTGYQHADFARTRKVDLRLFTLDKLVKMVRDELTEGRESSAAVGEEGFFKNSGH